MWKLVEIADRTPTEDGIIIVVFVITNGEETVKANMGFERDATDEVIDAAIATYLEELNKPEPTTDPVPPLSSEQLAELADVLAAASSALSDSAFAVRRAVQYVETLRAGSPR